MKQSGIYRIRNIIDDKGYIGSASYFNHRFIGHRTVLRKNKHHSIHLQRAWNKYGEDQFKFEIIEILENPTKELLLQREQYWIDYYKSYDKYFGYNICKIAGSCKGIEREETQINKEKIKEFLLKNGFKPSGKAKDLNERHLGKILIHYLDKNGDNFDLNMVEFCKNYKAKKDYLIEQVKNEILNFCLQHGFRPRQDCKDEKERQLGISLHNYITTVGKSYDKEFAEKIEIFPTKHIFKRELDKQRLRDFVYSRGYLPKRTSLDITEKLLGNLWGTWSNIKIKYYDEELVKELKKFPRWKDFNTLQKV